MASADISCSNSAIAEHFSDLAPLPCNIRASRIITAIIAVFLSATMCSCRVFTAGGNQKLKVAEELSRQGKYDEAIAAYKDHITDRLGTKNRPEWENPYFYYLLIGDVELGRERPQEALDAYKMAETNQIHKSLVSDRYRYVASWYEERGELDKALEVLKAHRELDPLLFDAVLDRVARAIIAANDQQQPAGTPVK